MICSKKPLNNLHESDGTEVNIGASTWQWRRQFSDINPVNCTNQMLIRNIFFIITLFAINSSDTIIFFYQIVANYEINSK